MLLTLITGFLHTGIELIIFRALHGISLALCLPSAVSILSNSFQQGRWRNISFGALGAGQPLGFAAGLVLSGALLDSIGWRWAFWIVAAISGLITGAAFFALPKVTSRERIEWNQLRKIDWAGAILSSASLGLLSYVMAYVVLLLSCYVAGKLLIWSVVLLVSLGLNGHYCRSFSQPLYLLPLGLPFSTGFTVKRNTTSHA
jgi:MFS family permease